MEHDRIVQLRESWNGTRCEHPRIVKERFHGVSTGQCVCAQCGGRMGDIEEILEGLPTLTAAQFTRDLRYRC